LLTDAKLSDFPKDLIEQFPQLKTLRYVFDEGPNAMTEPQDDAEPATLRELLIALKDALLAIRPRTLFVNDAEMIRRIGVPEKIAREAIEALDKNPRNGFPPKSKLWGNRRYWPALEFWFQQQNGIAPRTPVRT
jgi:hypothetical protein